MVAGIQLALSPVMFLLALVRSATAGMESSTRIARVVHHDNLNISPEPAGLVSTSVGSSATSLLPLKNSAVRLRRAGDDEANVRAVTSDQPGSSQQAQQAPVHETKSRHAETADAKEIKIWEEKVKKAEAKLALAKRRLAVEVHNQLVDKLRKLPLAPLPAGWKSTKDPKSGRLYYYKKNNATDKDGRPTFQVQWDPPKSSQAGGLVDNHAGTKPKPGDTPTGVTDPLPPSLSAFEPDHFADLSEYFGPFRLDYADHSIDLNDWNMVVQSPENIPGRGNLIIGTENYAADADNSFVLGEHNTARGFGVTVAGGKDNVGEGNGISVLGGEQNVARGNYTVVNGGYRNEADGSYSVVGGGVKNVAMGLFSSATGGQSNLAEGYASSVTSGKSNEALGKYASLHGGSGNKAAGNSSTVGGGMGQTAEGDGDTVFEPLTKQDLETLASADHVGNPFER